MSTEEFINIENIHPTQEDENYMTEEEITNYLQTYGKKIYQIQTINNSDEIKIMNIGILLNLNDTMINKFDFCQNYICYMLNCIYDLELLEKSNKNQKFHIIKILIFDKKNLSKSLACLSYDFNYESPIPNIQDYIHEKNQLNMNKNIKGSYSIKFNFANKYIELEKISQHSYMNAIFSKLINWLRDQQELILENLKNL